MAIDIEGSASSAANSASASSIDITHTVPAGTDLLLLFGGGRDQAINTSTTEDWVSSSEPFVEAIDFAESGANNVDFKVLGIISPTPKTETITVQFEATCSWQIVGMANFSGNVLTSVAAAINQLELTTNTFQNSTAFSSAGTAGNGLFCLGGHLGDDDPHNASVDASFVELLDISTEGAGAGNDDCTLHASYLLDGAPAGPTISWADNNYSKGVLFEIVAAAGAGPVVMTDIINVVDGSPIQ